MATIDVNGVELFYERFGAGDRLVLTHGAWTDARTWQAVTPALAQRFEVVVWDRRGHSRSGDGNGPGSVRQDADDLARLIEHLGPDPVHLVGNSAGGNVVLNLVTMRPDLVRTAAVHEPGPFGLIAQSDDPELIAQMEADRRVTDEVERLIAGGRAREAAEHFINALIAPGAWEALLDETKSVMVANAATVGDDLRDGWDVESVDVEALNRSEVPLLISAGSDSPTLEREAAFALARLVPHAQMVELDGAGHLPHRTHPDVYVAMVSGFAEDSSVPVRNIS